MIQGTEKRWPWPHPIPNRLFVEDCEVCKNKRYLICERDDGKRAVERCDNCSEGTLSDEEASDLARKDGIDCDRVYPCFIHD